MRPIYSDYSRQMNRCNDIQIIRKKELAAMLGVSVKTVHVMIKNNQLPTPLRSPNGQVTGWLTKAIDLWIEKHI